MNAEDIQSWLISDARKSGDSVTIVEGFALRLIEAGVPLWRARVAQRLANPLPLPAPSRRCHSVRVTPLLSHTSQARARRWE